MVIQNEHNNGYSKWACLITWLQNLVHRVKNFKLRFICSTIWFTGICNHLISLSFRNFKSWKNLFLYLFSIFECISSRKIKTKNFSSEVISSYERSIWAEWGQFEVISGILSYPCVLMGGIFKALYVRLSDFFLISSG